ncbi:MULTISPECIES: Ltp family lipoprotein [Micrococcaceae]|uniref:Putative host cell surface-exposed lipoprotein Ltp-like HTH region domain-containing protein n=1 Tax=Pseudoglutamicibacter albus TaxID=98671 RepID=A0ABU1YYU3_9MICC|nr:MULTISPECIES: Ltp family lipoprotein [Micrococcaceae]MCG7305536.1 Ltp family lipoprotein [Pseudoglutamicibacter albus]MDR7292950.1 hypothetical protein [Pseudoglutamicibacter albus]
MSDHNSPQVPPASEPGDIPSSSSSPATTKKKSLWTRWWMIAIYVVLGIGIINALANGGDENASPAGSSTPSASETHKSQTSDGEKSSASTKTDKPTEKTIPTEYKSALRTAETYSDTMHMSKAGIYEQLTSEYGEKFTKEAAQYAIDNLKADYKKNALETAKNYQESMAMSPSAIHDQLTSEHGEKFTKEEADYAIANLD